MVSAYIQKNCDRNHEPARKGINPAREVGSVRSRRARRRYIQKTSSALTCGRGSTRSSGRTLPLIFPRALYILVRGRNWHLSSAYTGSSGCQGFKGPAPSTLLDELFETSFHENVIPGAHRTCSCSLYPIFQRKTWENIADTACCMRRRRGSQASSLPLALPVCYLHHHMLAVV